jgi:putative DNA primase/helicase
VIVVAEGFATGASIRMATGLPVLVAFDCGNLLPAAAAHGKARFIWAADNDLKTPGNPGITKATAASKALGGKVVAPPIAGDFNDLHLEQGLGAVMDWIYGAL